MPKVMPSVNRVNLNLTPKVFLVAIINYPLGSFKTLILNSDLSDLGLALGIETF